MKIIAFIEARQGVILEKILRHCGLWQDPPYRGPPPHSPSPPATAGGEGRGEGSPPDPDSRRTVEPDLEYLELTHRQDEASQMNLAFD